MIPEVVRFLEDKGYIKADHIPGKEQYEVIKVITSDEDKRELTNSLRKFLAGDFNSKYDDPLMKMKPIVMTAHWGEAESEKRAVFNYLSKQGLVKLDNDQYFLVADGVNALSQEQLTQVRNKLDSLTPESRAGNDLHAILVNTESIQKAVNFVVRGGQFATIFSGIIKPDKVASKEEFDAVVDENVKSVFIEYLKREEVNLWPEDEDNQRLICHIGKQIMSSYFLMDSRLGVTNTLLQEEFQAHPPEAVIDRLFNFMTETDFLKHLFRVLLHRNICEDSFLEIVKRHGNLFNDLVGQDNIALFGNLGDRPSNFQPYHMVFEFLQRIMNLSNEFRKHIKSGNQKNMEYQDKRLVMLKTIFSEYLITTNQGRKNIQDPSLDSYTRKPPSPKPAGYSFDPFTPFGKILTLPAGKEAFRQFLNIQSREALLEFWEAVEAYAACEPGARQTVGEDIVKTFLSEESEKPLFEEAERREVLVKTSKTYSPDVFNELHKKCWDEMASLQDLFQLQLQRHHQLVGQQECLRHVKKFLEINRLDTIQYEAHPHLGGESPKSIKRAVSTLNAVKKWKSLSPTKKPSSPTKKAEGIKQSFDVVGVTLSPDGESITELTIQVKGQTESQTIPLEGIKKTPFSKLAPYANFIKQFPGMDPVLFQAALMVLEQLDNPAIKGVEGIFRMSGSSSEIGRASEELQKGNLAFLKTEDFNNMPPHSKVGILKWCLKNLSEPLFLSQNFDALVQVMDLETDDEKVAAIRHIVDNLPVTNKRFLGTFVRFLSAVANNAERNSMTPSNLAIALRTNFLESSGDLSDPSEIQKIAPATAVLTFIFEHSEAIFKEAPTFNYTDVIPGAEAVVPKAEVQKPPVSPRADKKKKRSNLPDTTLDFFNHVMEEEALRYLFERYNEGVIKSPENLNFLEKVEAYKQAEDKNRGQIAIEIWERFLGGAGDEQINISGGTLRELKEGKEGLFKDGDPKKGLVADSPPKNIFDKALNEVKGVLFADTVPKFKGVLNNEETVLTQVLTGIYSQLSSKFWRGVPRGSMQARLGIKKIGWPNKKTKEALKVLQKTILPVLEKDDVLNQDNLQTLNALNANADVNDAVKQGLQEAKTVHYENGLKRIFDKIRRFEVLSKDDKALLEAVQKERPDDSDPLSGFAGELLKWDSEQWQETETMANVLLNATQNSLNNNEVPPDYLQDFLNQLLDFGKCGATQKEALRAIHNETNELINSHHFMEYINPIKKLLDEKVIPSSHLMAKLLTKAGDIPDQIREEFNQVIQKTAEKINSDAGFGNFITIPFSNINLSQLPYFVNLIPYLPDREVQQWGCRLAYEVLFKIDPSSLREREDSAYYDKALLDYIVQYTEDLRWTEYKEEDPLPSVVLLKRVLNSGNDALIATISDKILEAKLLGGKWNDDQIKQLSDFLVGNKFDNLIDKLLSQPNIDKKMQQRLQSYKNT